MRNTLTETADFINQVSKTQGKEEDRVNPSFVSVEHELVSQGSIVHN